MTVPPDVDAEIDLTTLRDEVIDRKHFARECRVRDYYAEHLSNFRPGELLVSREQGYPTSATRADMRTVDADNILREWEFKISADYRALGQIIQYVALARLAENFRKIRGVIAAFKFSPELPKVVEVANLSIELVEIPDVARGAGGIVRTTVADRNVRALPRIY